MLDISPISLYNIYKWNINRLFYYLKWTFLLFRGEKMARVTRYNIDWLNFNSRISTDHPILINTTGYYEATTSFETYNSIGRDDYYLMYIIDGQLTIEIDGSESTLKKGAIVIFPPEYRYKYRGNPPAHYLYVHFTGSYADRFLEECCFNSFPCIIKNDFSIELQNKFNLMIDTFLLKKPLWAQRCACILQDILIDIHNDALDKLDNSPLKASLKHIHSFFTSKIDIPYLAGLENLSNSRYVAVFKQQTGKSPNEYIIGLRLQFAKSLLESTNMSIKQISERVGYSDQYFFSRLFKKHMGISPQGYRKGKLL